MRPPVDDSAQRTDSRHDTGSLSADPHLPALPALYDTEEDKELASEFITEANEHVASIETIVLGLEQDPSNMTALNSVFRSFHSIKGLAGFLSLPALQNVSHEVESLLALARTGAIAVDSTVVDIVLEGADFIKRSARRVELLANGSHPFPEDLGESLVSKVQALVNGEPAQSSRQSGGGNTEDCEIRMPSASQAETLPDKSSGDSSSDNAVRVSVSKLDYLVDMVGELVIAQSLLHFEQGASDANNSRLTRNLAQLKRITGEIQRTAMSMRMITVHHLFGRMARLVRDLARKTGKDVDLETSGEDTELDRRIVEALVDPLMHMIRNSIDHGIESADEREAAGKPRSARITLKAHHQAGQIVIEVADDGRGIDRERVMSRALSAGIISEGADLTESEVYQLLFQPGFSTAKQITDVSGRGVGLDVVRKHVEKLRGRIRIESTLGAGTSFALKLPLTLAIVDGFVVEVGIERYIVPMFAVREVLKPTAAMITTVQNRGEVALVRGALMPVVRLHRRFKVVPSSEAATDGILVISDSGGRPFGLLVDRLMGKQEVVIKGMGEQLKHVAGIAGSAILGDGHVGLILDMEGLCHDAAA